MERVKGLSACISVKKDALAFLRRLAGSQKFLQVKLQR